MSSRSHSVEEDDEIEEDDDYSSEPRVSNWNESEAIEAAIRAKKIESPQSRNGFEDPDDISLTELKLLQERLDTFVDPKEPKSDAEVKKDRAKFLRKYKVDPAYNPPSERLLLHRDISRNAMANEPREPYEVPVYSDLGNAREKFKKDFSYITQNVARPRIWPEPLNRFKYRCECDGPCTTAACRCFEINSLANKSPIGMKNGKIDIGDPACDIGCYALMCCGPACGCPAECPNRAENMVMKNKLEVFKRDREIGFGVRTLNNIAFGELVCEFVGEVMDQSSFSRDSHNWAMEIARRNQKTLRDDDTKIVLEGLRQLTDCDLSDKQWLQVKSVKTYIYMLDPSRKGNLARFFSHGCWPNLQLVRVISNYAAIQHHRIFFFAAHAIPAGSELFFHYGKEFGNRLPCRCGTPLCFKEKLLKSFTRKQMEEMMTDIHRHWKRIAKEKEDKCDDSTAQRSASLPTLGIANSPLGDEDEPHPASEPPLDFSRFASSRKKARAISIDAGEGQTETSSASPTGSDDVITLSSDGTSDEDKPIDVITIDDSIEEQTAQPNEPVHEKQTSSNDDDKAVEKEKTKEKMQLNPSIIRGSQGEKQPQRLVWYKDCKLNRPPPLMKPRRNTAATAKKKTAAAEVSKATTQSKETTMNTVGASGVGDASLRKPYDATALFEEATGIEETPQPSPRTTAEGHSPLFDSAVAYLGDSVETEDGTSQEPVEEAPKPRTEATVGDPSTTVAEETAGGEVPAPKSRTTTERTRATAERKRATAERKRATAGRDATAPKSRSAAGRDRATVRDHSTIMAPVGQVKSRNDGTGTEEPIAAGAPVTPSSLGLQGSSADAEAGHTLRLPCKSARPKSLERLLREICRPPSMAVCRNPRPDSVVILNTNRYGGRKYTAREIEEYEKTMTSKTKETDSGGDEARVDESSIQETGEATAENSEATAQAITDTTVGASWVADTSLNKPLDATALMEEVNEIQETPQPGVMATEGHSPLFDSVVADLDDFVETEGATAQEPLEEGPQPSPEDTAEGVGSIVDETAGGEATAPKGRATSEKEKPKAGGHNTIVAPEPVVEERLISDSAEEQEEEDVVSKKEELTVAKEATPTAGPEAPPTGKTVATPICHEATPISCNPSNASPATEPLRQPKTASPRHSPPPKKHKMIEGIKNARRRSSGRPKPSESTISKNPIVEEVAEATSQPMATLKEEMATAQPRITDEEEMATAKFTAPVATEPTHMEVEIVVLDEVENDEPQIDSGEVPVLAPVASSPAEPEDAVAHPPDLERELSPLALVDLAEAERDPSPEVLGDDDDIPTDPRLTAYEDSRDRPYRDGSSSAPKDDNYPTQRQWDDDGIDDDGRSSREGPETDQTLDDFERELQVRCWADFAHQGQEKVRQEEEYGRRIYGGSAGNRNDSGRRDYRNQDVRTRPSERNYDYRSQDLSCRRMGYHSWCYGEERDDRYHRGERGHSDFRGRRSYEDGRFGYGHSMEYERMDGGYRSQDRRPLEETTYSDYESGGLGDGDGRAYGRNDAFYETGGSGYGQSMEYEEMGGGYHSQDHRPREETTYRSDYGSGGLEEGGERVYGRNDAFYETGGGGYGQFIDTHHGRGRKLSSYQDRDQGGHFTYDYHPQNYEERDRSQFCGRNETVGLNYALESTRRDVLKNDQSFSRQLADFLAGFARQVREPHNLRGHHERDSEFRSGAYESRGFRNDRITYGEESGGGRRDCHRLSGGREDGGRTAGWRNEREQRGGGRRGSRRLPVRREDGGRTTGWRNETRNRRRTY